MFRADLGDSDSFFENEIESDVEQTLISASVDAEGANADGRWRISSTGLMMFQISHADESGER
jgi:hypothetical protein